VIEDEQLNFITHVQEKNNTATKTMGVIRSFKYLNKENFVWLCKVLSKTTFRICTSCLEPIKEGVNSNIQRQSTKLVPEVKNYSYEERLKRLNILTLV